MSDTNGDHVSGAATARFFVRLAAPSRLVAAQSLADARMKCRANIDEHDLGSGDWVGGAVYDATTGEQVARISYNGRCWKPGPWPQPEIEPCVSG